MRPHSSVSVFGFLSWYFSSTTLILRPAAGAWTGLLHDADAGGKPVLSKKIGGLALEEFLRARNDKSIFAYRLTTCEHFSAPSRRAWLFVRHELDLVIVVVVTGEFQELRRSRRRAGYGHQDVAGGFQAGDLLALAVLQVKGHILIDANLDLVNALFMSGQLQEPHHVDRHALAGLHLAGGAAMGAVLVDAALEGRADALARHFNDAED